jgi:hypothetical protein
MMFPYGVKKLSVMHMVQHLTQFLTMFEQMEIAALQGYEVNHHKIVVKSPKASKNYYKNDGRAQDTYKTLAPRYTKTQRQKTQQTIKFKPKNIKGSQYLPIQNNGNTCYFNSLIITLFYLEKDDLLNEHTSILQQYYKHRESGCFNCLIGSVLNAYLVDCNYRRKDMHIIDNDITKRISSELRRRK